MSQIIDLGNSGIHFAESGVINLGSHGSGIQIIGPPGIAGKYMLKMSGIKDLVSKNSQTDTSAGPAYYIHPTTGELVTVAAGEPLIHPTLGNVSLPAYTQLCQDSEDPGEWALLRVAYADTGETFGPFTEVAITSSGTESIGIYDRSYIWQSSVTGSPSGILYFSIRYRAGTSGKINLLCFDASLGGAMYCGEIGYATTDVLSVSPGTLTIISDVYDPDLGYYVLKAAMLFTNLNNISIGIGPYSDTVGETILVLGADVSEDPAILDFHVPSSGGNVSIASRAGTTKLPALSTGFPKFYDALDGAADGVELVVNGGVDVDSDWEKGAGWNILNGMVNCDGSQLGGTAISNTIPTVVNIGEKYLFTVDVTSISEGYFTMRLGGVSSNLISSPGTHTTRLTAVSTTAFSVVGNSSLVCSLDNISVKRISPAAARHQFTWTPGVSYTDHTTVESIMTPSDADGFLKASAAGGFELSDGTNTLESTGINWTAGTSYPMEIVYGYNEALDDYKMELSVYVDGAWISVMGDFDQSFDPGTDFIYGLSNTYQSAVKGHTVERLQQSHWKLYPTYTFNMPMTTGMVPYDLISGGLLTSDLPGIRYDMVDGVLTEFAADEPVITEFGLRGGGVIENLQLYSENINIGTGLWWKVNSLGVIQNTTEAPDGNETADKIYATTSLTSHYVLSGIVQGSVGVIKTFSVFVKHAGSDWVQISSSSGFDYANGWFNINISTGQLGNTGANDKIIITPYMNGWFRISITDISIVEGTEFLISPILSNVGSRNPVFSGDGESGVCVWGAQLHQGTYPLPYVPTTIAPVTTVTEAGSAGYGNRLEDLSTEFPQLYDVLDGEADGVELISNGDFSDGTVNWLANDGAILTVESGKLHVKNSLVDAGDAYQFIQTTIGERYRLTGTLLNGNANVRLIAGTSVDLSEYIDFNAGYPTETSVVTNFTALTTTTCVRISTSSITIDDFGIADNISVKQITPAAGELHIQWTPLYNAADITGTDHNIISWDGATSSLTYDADNNLLKLTDGTNTASVACTLVANQTYEIKCVHGRHPSEGDDKMQIIVDSTAGTITDFAGTFSPGDDGVFCLNNDAHHYVKVLEVFKGDSSNKPPTWWI